MKRFEIIIISFPTLFYRIIRLVADLELSEGDPEQQLGLQQALLCGGHNGGASVAQLCAAPRGFRPRSRRRPPLCADGVFQKPAQLSLQARRSTHPALNRR